MAEHADRLSEHLQHTVTDWLRTRGAHHSVDIPGLVQMVLAQVESKCVHDWAWIESFEGDIAHPAGSDLFHCRRCLQYRTGSRPYG